jgi:TonB family protein
MRCFVSLRHLCAAEIFCAAVVLLSIHARADQLDQSVRDRYQGKTFVLRNFYKGAKLKYDSTGEALSAPKSGDWTVDGVLIVENLQLSGGNLRLHASRVFLGWAQDGFQPLESSREKKRAKQGKKQELETGKILEIDVDFGSNPNSDQVDAALSRIFLTEHDRFVEMVPGFWKPCVRAAVGAKPVPEYPNCRFSAQFLSVAGVASIPEESSEPKSDSQSSNEASSTPIAKVGNGVSPPHVTRQHEPEFTDEARRVKFEGVTTLMLIVSKEGNAGNIRIVNPLGCGLDERAVQTVSEWKFMPALKGGEPVAVQIAVEVSFHTY